MKLKPPATRHGIQTTIRCEMPSSIEILTSVDTFHDLHILCDNNKKIVKVEREALLHLLLDHHTFLHAISASIKITAPPPKRRREKIID